VDLLLLDEPTNHLDVSATAWLRQYLREGLTGVTMLMVSHDADFLSEVCTDVIHFSELKLEYYEGGIPAFRAARPDVILPTRALVAAAAAANDAAAPDGSAPSEAAGGAAGEDGEDESAIAAGLAAAAAALAAGTIKPFVFPDPGALDGIKNKNKVILRAVDVTYTHPGAEAPVLKRCTARLCLASRVGVVGVNGAGKTTLLRLLVGEAAPPPRGNGELWRHENLRVAYVAQHALHHLEEAQSQTPVEYIQQRFFLGRDAEDLKKSTIALTAEEQALRAGRGGVDSIVGRRAHGKELFYEVKKTGRPERDNTWEPLTFLAAMPPYVMKLVRDYDERLKAQQGGMEVRPLSAVEVKAHLAAFGIGEELALSKIKGFSGGQKSRLVMASAMWNRPHVLALDEPTNYLDRESLAALAAALRAFAGAVIVVSHSTAFVDALCSERWRVEGGTLTVIKERRIED
jgi:ATPase subunit of ABC transporter with duplicated ATPase domains